MGRTKWDAQMRCEFKGVSLGDSTARVGVSIDRESMSYDTADELLCGRQVKVEIVNKHHEGKALAGMEGASGVTILAIASIKSFAVKPKEFSFGLTFDIDAIDPKELSMFPQRSGEIRLKHEGDLPTNGEANADDD